MNNQSPDEFLEEESARLREIMRLSSERQLARLRSEERGDAWLARPVALVSMLFVFGAILMAAMIMAVTLVLQ